MSKSKDLGTAYGMSKRKKSGEVGQKQYRQALTEKMRNADRIAGINKPGVMGDGESEAGYQARRTVTSKTNGKGQARQFAKDSAKKVLTEMRSMPKPNLPMADGGSIRSGKTRHQNEKGVHSESFSYDKPGKSDSGVYIRSHGSISDKSKKLLKAEHQDIMEQQSKIKPNLQGLAEGGMIDLDGGSEESMDHEDSMADAIMARRDRLHEEIDSGAHDLDSAVRMAEGGEAHSGAYHAELGRIRQSEKAARETGASQRTGGLHTPEQERALREKHYGKRQKLAEGGEVDIDDNAEEQPNEFYDLNEDAALKENYDSDMDDVSQPEDSNEDGHMIDKDEHDMVDKIRSGMKKRQR